MGLTPEQLQELEELEELEQLEKEVGSKSIAQRMGVFPSMPSSAPAGGPRPRELIDYEKSAIEEMHPAISAKDRAIVKNFAQNADAGQAYLKQQYPNLKIGHDGERYLISSPGDEFNRVLDPNTGVLSSDLPQDLTDVAYDVASAVGETGAAALGAGAGLVAAGPAGALAGGALAAGGAGAGLEYGRQKIGQSLGIPQEVDPMDVAISGGVSGLTAGAFGTAPLKAAVNKYAQKQFAKGLSKEAVQDLIEKSGQGAIKRSYLWGTRKAAPWLASKASGIKKNLITGLGNRMDEFEDVQKNGIKKFVKNSRSDFSNKLKDAQDVVGKQIDSHLDNTTGTVDISKAKEILRKHIEELQQQALSGRDPDIARLKAAQEIWNANFAKKQIPEALEGVAEAAPVYVDLPDEADARLANRIKQDLSTTAKTGRATPGSITSRHSSGTPVDEKMLLNTVDDSRAAVVEGLEGVVTDKPGYKTSKEQYAYLKDQEKNLGNMFKSDKRYYNALRNLDRSSSDIDREALSQLDKLLGTKTGKDAEMVQMYSSFATPPSAWKRTAPLATGGIVLGGYGGYQASGGDMRAGTLGGALGGAIGGGLASPTALKFAIKNGLRAEKQAAKVLPKGNIPQAGLQSLWELLQNKQEDFFLTKKDED